MRPSLSLSLLPNLPRLSLSLLLIFNPISSISSISLLTHFFLPLISPLPIITPPGSSTSRWNYCRALQGQLQIRWRQIHSCSFSVSSLCAAQCLHTKYYTQFSTEKHKLHNPGQNGSALFCLLQLSPWKLL